MVARQPIRHFSPVKAVPIAAKDNWTMTLRMSRPLFIGSYLQVTWWALAYEKKEKFASNDNSRNLNVV